MFKNTRIESKMYPIMEINNTIKVNFFLLFEFKKLNNKKIDPKIKPGRKLLYTSSPKTHISHVSWYPDKIKIIFTLFIC